MSRIDSFLRLVAEQKASDLHFAAGCVPLIRHDGELVRLPFRKLSAHEARSFIGEILTPDEAHQLDEKSELDFVYSLPACGRFRVNVFQQTHGVAAVFRVIPSKVPTIEDLGLPHTLRKLTDMQNGLVLICGPTGSGKTSTLAALVDYINKNPNRPRHIITVEDPVEFVHEPAFSVVSQRQVGLHTESFAAALRSALREAPDVVVVGEMRDLETINLALSAAETGVLVLGTLHTNSAAQAVDRIIDAFPEDAREQMRGAISVLLKAVVAQHLVKRASGEGRVALCEVLLQSVAVSNMIRENKVFQIEAFLQSSDQSTGCQSLDGSVFRAIREGLITLEEGVKAANDPEKVRRMAAELPPEDV